MLVCGVDLKASEARLALARSTHDCIEHQSCETKKLSLADDTKSEDLIAMQASINAFAHRNNVEAFIIKSRKKTGQMASGGVSFKIEALFQLSGTTVHFVSPQAIKALQRSNRGGVPRTVLAYQSDAFLSAATFLTKHAGG